MTDFNRKKNRKLIIMVSGRGNNMRAIINTCKSKKWPIEVVAVISDCECKAIKIAQSLNVPSFVFDRKSFKSRLAFETNIIKKIQELNPSLIALAGFMRILSPEFCNSFPDMLVNIHPSLLPKYKGLNTHKRALEDNSKVHGASVHAVNKFLDEGSVLCQGVVPILPTDNEYDLAKRVMEVEVIIYPKSIAAILSGGIKLIAGNWKKDIPDGDFPQINFESIFRHSLFEKKSF